MRPNGKKDDVYRQRIEAYVARMNEPQQFPPNGINNIKLIDIFSGVIFQQDKFNPTSPQQIGISNNTIPNNQYLFQNQQYFEDQMKEPMSKMIQMYQQKNHYIQNAEPVIILHPPNKQEQKLPSLNEVFGQQFVESTKPTAERQITENCVSLSKFKL